MSDLLLLWFMLVNLHTLMALFQVTAPKSTYIVKYGDTVKMTCNFPFPHENHDALNELKVSWEHIGQDKLLPQQAVKFDNGKEDLTNQDITYRGRASIFPEQLMEGEAILQIRDVKLTDAGTYLCLLQLDGSDYHKITLEVQASYTNIQKSIEISDTDGTYLVTCYSLGFPKAEVYWQANGINVSSGVNTSYLQTKDGLYNTSSTIKILYRDATFSCVFWNEALNESTEAFIQLTGSVHQDPDPVLKIKIIVPVIALISLLFIITLASEKCHLRRRLCFKESRKKDNTDGPI